MDIATKLLDREEKVDLSKAFDMVMCLCVAEILSCSSHVHHLIAFFLANECKIETTPLMR